MSNNKDGFEAGQELTFEQVQRLMRKAADPAPKQSARKPKGGE